MQIVCRVVADMPNEYVGKKGAVKDQRLSLLDIDESGHRMKNTFDYDLSDDEKAKYAGKLLDKQVRLGVSDFLVFGGRLRARGKLLEVK